MIRRASIADVPEIGRIINDAAEYGLMLHRSQSYLYEHVRDFCVAELDGQVVGVCGLNIVWANLAEIYALAVDRRHRGKGLGGKLVEACVEEATQLGIARLMTLTYEKSFFERLKFTIIDRQDLPLKVWSQCVHCLKNHACDEIAMIRVLIESDAAAVEIPIPEDEYDVPIQVRVIPKSDGLRGKMSEPDDE